MKKLLLAWVILAAWANAFGLTYMETRPATEDSYGVFWVRDPHAIPPRYQNAIAWRQFAELGTTIEVEVKDLDDWLELKVSDFPELKDQSPNQRLGYLKNRLLLIINGQPFDDITPNRIEVFTPHYPYHQPIYNLSLLTKPQEMEVWQKWQDENKNKKPRYTAIEYPLLVTSGNTAVWRRVFSSPDDWSKRLEVTVGLKKPDGSYITIPTWVRPPKIQNEQDFEQNNFSVQFFGTKERYLWPIGILLSLGLLFYLSRIPGILRDPNSLPRPDGLQPFSLSRIQMIFWFYIILLSYLLLWKVAGTADPLNSTATVLLGITTATAVGAGLISPPAPSPLTKEEAEEKAHDYRRKSPIQRFFHDLIMDGDYASPARFQMLAWTLFLSFIFLHETWRNLKMHEFDIATLALMGISSGAYLGFKQQGK